MAISLFLITGPAGVGKSTISKKIAENLEKSILIEGDEIYNLVVGGYVSPWKQGNHLRLFWNNCKSIIENSIKEGFDVVFNYVLDKEQIKDIKQNFPFCEIKFVCSMVDEATIVQRDKLRPIDCQMGERSLILLQEMKDENFSDDNILDTSHLTIEQSYMEILNNNRFII